MVKMIVFLGNPGKQYEETRHNIGFSICNVMYPSANFQKKFNGLLASENGLKLLKPQTYMNESGRSVALAATYFAIHPEELLVVHDDLELEFGEIALQAGGGLKGHNGLKSIRDYLKSDSFLRLRFGIGRPTKQDVASYVLSHFSKEEKHQLPQLTEKAITKIKANM
ncbi:MAG: aminoacyl-tRNA hydrolase [Spirochaetia bacterium]|jgi:PTH1 family peptidyl-tRNA hydrolase|nr:aminoacyl-tRNA hydrolase [Spirochaetia bacterium]